MATRTTMIIAMMTVRVTKALWIAFMALSFAVTVRALAREDAPEPILRIETGGHSSFVTSLAWHPNGRELWSAGLDKIVRVWRLTDEGIFVGKPEESIRVPIGPGPRGQIDSIAFSSDGRWLAIGGYANLTYGAASFRDPGVIVPLSSVQLNDIGAIYLLDRSDNSFRRLEGHNGVVKRLVFARAVDGSEQLISAGDDTDAKQQKTGSIRIWDVASGQQVDGVLLPEPPKNRPSLVAIRPSSTKAGVHVLASFGNEKIVHWESSKPPQIRTYRDGRNNNMMVSGPDAKWIATASADDATSEGKVTFWNINSAGLPELDPRRVVKFPRSGDEMYLPLGLTLFASSPDGKEDHLAVALCVIKSSANGPPTPDRFQLRVLTVPNSGQTSLEIVRKELWQVDSSGIQMPDLATTLKGRHLAIAGNPNHSISVISISELLKKNMQFQQLKGNASFAHQIAFVEREGGLGLRITERSFEIATQPAKYVFGFQTGQIDSMEATPWVESKPDVQGWSVRQSELQLTVMHQGRVVQTMNVPKRHQISASILTSPLKETGMPLLIVAAHESGQPWLGVFDVKDGAMKREFDAHTGTISSLALTRDSRLLATACSDQTIAVWDLSDIETILRPRSTMKGVALVEKNQTVEVGTVQESANANLPLKTGDQLLGYFDPTLPSPFRTWPRVLEKKDPLWEQKSGTQVKVRRQRGTEVADVFVTLSQLADERKPLFQLMFTNKNNIGRRQWIGWSPLGPFDASDPEIRQRLGWHFNVSRPKAPIAFAPVDQYPNLFQPGFLSDSVKNVGRPAEIVPITLMEPQMNLQLSEAEHWDKSGTAILRQPPQAVTLQINNDSFPAEIISGIRLIVDNDVQGAFRPNGKDHWLFDSQETVAWTRGEHRLQAELETRTIPSRKYIVESQLVFIPKRPIIEPILRPTAMTKESTLIARAKVKSSQEGVPIDVALVRIQDGGEREIIKTWDTGQGDNKELDLELSLDLKVGRNQFIVEAQNRGTTSSTKSLEVSTWNFDISRVERDMNPPTIELTSLQSPSDSKQTQIKLESGELVVVESEKAILSGTIHANENLTAATIDGEIPMGFISSSAADFAFQVPLRLKPGHNAIRIASKTDLSPESMLDLDVLFRQPLPEVEMVLPIGGQTIATLLSPSTIQLRARFQQAPDLRPISVLAMVNGLQLEQPMSVDLKAGEIQGEIPLRLGRNTLQLQLSNDTGSEAQTSPITVYYQPAPIVDDWLVPGEIEGTTFDIRLSGQAASPIERLLLDGREIPQSQWQSEQSGNRFTLNVSALPWQSDRRQISLAAFANGIAKPAFATVELPKRKLPAQPPTLAFLSPSVSASVTSERINIEYSVRSIATITNVELLHDGQPVPMPPIPPVQDGQDSVVRRLIEVQLRAGTNVFQLVAANKDSLSSQSLILNYVPSPVEIELDSVAPIDRPDASQRLSLKPDGTWRVDMPVETSRNIIKGRVRWHHRDDVAINDARSQIWISVNGFKQAVRLQAPTPNSLERQFVGQVHLFREQDNLIEVMATDLRQMSGIKKVIKVDCHSPQLPRQRLHLVIIGVGVLPADEAGLVRDAVASLGGTELRTVAKKFVFTSPAFAECNGYGPYSGAFVSPEKIGSILHGVGIGIQQLQARDPANDVMLVYFRGGEQVDLGGQFYLTTRQSRDGGEADLLRTPIQLKNFAVSSGDLGHFVNHCPGSHLLLLDVTRSIQSQNVANNCFVPGAATFRYAWLKGVEVPDDARLISAWQVAPKSSRLNQIEKQLSTNHARLMQRYKDSVLYEKNVPVELRELVLGDSK